MSDSDPFQKERLEIERQKLALEQAQAKWTRISIMVPILAAIGTVAYGFWNTNAQTEANLRLEIVKSIMQSTDPNAAVNKAAFYAKLFPKEFDGKSLASINWHEYGRSNPNAAGELEFVKLLASKGLTARQSAELWRAVFSSDDASKWEAIWKVLDQPETETKPK